MATSRPQGGTRNSRARVSDRDEYPAIGVAAMTAPRSGIVMGPPPRVRLRPGVAGVRTTSPGVPVLLTVALTIPEVVLSQVVEPEIEVVATVEPEVATVQVVEPQSVQVEEPERLETVQPELVHVAEPEPAEVMEPTPELHEAVDPETEPVRTVDVLPESPLLRRLPPSASHRLSRVTDAAVPAEEFRRAAVERTRRTVQAGRRRQVLLSAAVIVVIAGLLVGAWRFSARADAAARPDWNSISATTVRTSQSTQPSVTPSATTAVPTDASVDPAATASVTVVTANLPAALVAGPVWGRKIAGSCGARDVPTSKDDAAATISHYVDCMNEIWAPLVAGSANAFKPLVVKMFDSSTTSGCGTYTAPTTAAYCPKDATLYVSGTALEQAMTGRFYAIELVTYEYTHHVQGLTGIYEATFRAGWDADERTRRAQLNAQCLSFALIAHVKGFDPTAADLASFREGWSAGPGSPTYGSIESLKAWGEKGLAATTVSDCNTFVAPASAVA